MNIIPETTGAVLLSCDRATGEFSTIPIVAWAYVAGNLVFPLFDIARPSGVGPLEGVLRTGVSGETLEIVTHPHSRKSMTPQQFYSLCREMIENGVGVEVSGTEALKKVFAHEAIRFDAESYKTKSFWKMPVANAVFEIGKNETYPADKRCLKIDREEFGALKKEGWKLLDDPRSFGTPQAVAEMIVEEVAAESEPEDDDNEGQDLI